MIVEHKCYQCGFSGEVVAENNLITCPACLTPNDVWLDGELEPERHVRLSVRNMTDIEKLKAGYHFRNGEFPDRGHRYKLRFDGLGFYDIVEVGDEYFDLQGHTSPHYIKKFDGDVVICGHAMREMEGSKQVLTFLLSTLIFEELSTVN